jgi:carbon storage regulator
VLVLTRKVGERIRVGPAVVVTVLRCKTGVVRLGVEAPATVRVLREEPLPAPPSSGPDPGTAAGVVAPVRPPARVGARR